MKEYLVLDIGGSAIKAAIINEERKILERDKVPTPMDTLDHFVEAIGLLYDRYHERIAGMAISMPGVIDPQRGYNYSGGALTYIKNLDTVKLLQERCPTRITIGNDAKCAANAEVGFGNLQDCEDAVVMILGTGIGGCLVKNRQVVNGKHFSAGEFSFIMTNKEDTHSFSNFFGVSNGSAGLQKRVQESLGTKEELDGFKIFEMANAGNEQVKEGIDRFARDLAIQIYNMQAIFDPEKVAIGGGISAQPFLIERIQANVKAVVEESHMPIPMPIVVPCQFRNDANLFGALYQHLHMTSDA